MPLNSHDKKIILSFITHENLNIECSTGMADFTRSNPHPNALVLDVGDTKSLQAIMREINEINKTKENSDLITVRAAAGGRVDERSQSYSFSNCVDGNIIIRLTGNEFQNIRTDTYKNNHVHVGASVQVGTLSKVLYDQHRLVLPTESLIPYVTVVGLAANAGHGTGKDQPTFAGLTQSMTICLPNGELVTLDEDHADFNTISAAHMGLFGIVTEVQLKCLPAKKLQCIMEARSVPEFIDEVRNGLFYNDPYVSVMYIPNYLPDEITNARTKNVIVYRWRPVDTSVNDVNHHPDLDKFNQAFQMNLVEGLNVMDFLRDNPDLIPPFMRYVSSKAVIGETDRMAIGPWNERIHYQHDYPTELTDAAYFFEVGKESKEIITAFEGMVSALTECAMKKEYPLALGVYLRFIQGHNGGLSPASHKEGNAVCIAEMPTAPGIPGYESFRSKMQKFFLKELNGKPHWGKYVSNNLDVAKMYGENYTQFMETYNRWYTSRNMDPVRNPLLDPFHKRILQIGNGATLAEQQVALAAPLVQKPKVDNVVLAEALLKQVHDGKELKQCLRGMSQEKRACVSKVSVFNKPVAVEEKKEDKKMKRGCCTIM